MPNQGGAPAQLRILATRVGRPTELARANGTSVRSAIAKVEVAEPWLDLDPINLAGDDQADRTVHGGVDKAVYSYPSEHWPFWTAELGFEAGPGTLGENISTAGLTEEEVHIGDRFTWGEAVVEVSQPRAPCYKFALHVGDPHALKLMVRSGYSGWYLRVIAPGRVESRGAMVRIVHAADAPTVREVFVTTHDRDPDPAAVRHALSSPALADQWAQALKR